MAMDNSRFGDPSRDLPPARTWEYVNPMGYGDPTRPFMAYVNWEYLSQFKLMVYSVACLLLFLEPWYGGTR